MQFEIAEHQESVRYASNASAARKQSLFAKYFSGDPAHAIFKLKEAQYPARCSAQPSSSLVYQPEPEVESLDERVAGFEVLVAYTQSQNANARRHAFSALEMDLVAAKQHGAAAALRLYYAADSTPLVYALTAIEHDVRNSLQPLLLISQLVQCEECSVCELLAPFSKADGPAIGLFHKNVEHIIAALYDRLNDFTPEQRDVAFLILERIAPESQQIVRLFEDELALQMHDMQTQGAFFSIAGRASLRSMRLRRIDAGVLPLLLGNFSYSEQGCEILTVVMLILRYLIEENRVEEAHPIAQFVDGQTIEQDQFLRSQDQLCCVAYMLGKSLRFDDTALAYIRQNYQKYLLSAPFVAFYVAKQMEETELHAHLRAAAVVFEKIPVSIVARCDYLEIYAPQIQFNDSGMRKVHFAWLFKEQCIKAEIELRDYSLPECYQYLIRRGCCNIRYLEARFECDLAGQREALDRYDSVGFVGMFMLAYSSNLKIIENSVLSKLSCNAQDIIFALSFAVACENARLPVPYGSFRLLMQTYINKIPGCEVKASAANWYRYPEYALELAAKILRMQAFIQREDAAALVHFIDAPDVDCSRLQKQLKEFYNIE